MANHTDEHGVSVLAQSKIAKRMRGAMKGRANSMRTAETKSIKKKHKEISFWQNARRRAEKNPPKRDYGVMEFHRFHQGKKGT